MVPHLQLPLGLQPGRLLPLQRRGGHLRVVPACRRRGRFNELSTQAGALPCTPPSTTAKRAWPSWERWQPSSVASLLVQGWGLQTAPCKVSQFAYGGKAFWIRQVATSLRGPGKPPRIVATQAQGANAAGRRGTRERQDLSRSTLVQDHARWWDGTHQKWDSRLQPHLSHPESEETVWLKGKPAWVDGELTNLESSRVLELGGASSSSPCRFSSNHVNYLIGPGFKPAVTPESVRKLCQQGHLKETVDALEALVETNSVVDKYLLYSVLRECIAKKDLLLGGQVHALAARVGLGSDTFLCTHFIRMYAGHGRLQKAMDVFRGVALPDTFMWSSIISANVKQGQAQQAIQLYRHMRATKTKPNGHALVAALQACAAARDLRTGKQVHDDSVVSGTAEPDMFVCSCLVDMYAKCGSLEDARRVFDGLREKNVVTWNAMIAGYARAEGMGQQALGLYTVMLNQGLVVPDAVTFVSLLQACANVGVSALKTGRQLHSQLKDRRLESHVVVGGVLVNMYVKCGSLESARSVFDRLSEKNVVTWAAMIAGYAQQEGMGQEALGLYSAMDNQGMVAPNAVTFASLLQACANIGSPALEKGRQLHAQLKDQRLESDVVVGQSLVNMYVKCGSLKDARFVFDALSEKSVVTWNAMISGYAQQEGMGQEAWSLHSAMLNESSTVAPNAVTFVCLLQACANAGWSALEKGKQLHCQVKDRKLECDVAVGGSLVNMYVKCGSVKDARIVFDQLSDKNVVTWTAMIAGYAQQHQEGMGPQEALNIYSAMRDEGTAVPDAVTYVCLLEACANVGAVYQGRELHSEIRERGFECDALIGTCLVKMYAKFGCLMVLRQVFDRLPAKDLVTWTALLKAYAEHGEGGMAIRCFEELSEQGIKPDEATYACLFTACSHAGLVDQGQHYFETMLERHGVEPNDQLYCCMVDLFGRSGHLDRAERMLCTSGLADNAVSWKALLSACKIYGDAETGKRCFDHLVKLEPAVGTSYLLLGSIYGNAGRWGEVGQVERLRIAAGARKVPGKACIEVKNKVHEFTVGEERSGVAATLRKMSARVKEGGHVPQTQLVLRANVSEQAKEDALCGHAEKLALAYGLLNTPAGSTLVLTKNLRMCNDCHSSTKIMSQLEMREIVVRDGHKVHRFQNGACSCQDRP